MKSGRWRRNEGGQRVCVEMCARVCASVQLPRKDKREKRFVRNGMKLVALSKVMKGCFRNNQRSVFVAFLSVFIIHIHIDKFSNTACFLIV